MSELIDINGAKMEKDFFEANLAEARSYHWEKSQYPKAMDHSHCLICTIAIPEEGNIEGIAYRSREGWLCRYCYNRFFGARED